MEPETEIGRRFVGMLRKALGDERPGHKYFSRHPKAGGGYEYTYTGDEYAQLYRHLHPLDRPAQTGYINGEIPGPYIPPDDTPKDDANTASFLANMTPHRAVKARDALTRQVSIHGKITTRKEWAEKVAATGGVVANHRPDGADDVGRVFLHPDRDGKISRWSDFMEEKHISKTALDYAAHLIAKRVAR